MIVKPLLAGLAALSLTASSFAQTPAPAAQEFSAEAFRAHVTFLADDLLEGRDTGSRGYEIAARYVATQFAALGLQPAGVNGSWYQPVNFIRYRSSPNGTITVGNHNFSLGRDAVLRASPDPAALAVDAPLVFAGYGLDMPSHGFDDYRGLEVRGKIVVVLSGIPQGTPSDIAAHLDSAKRRMAGARGAVGMIIVRTRADAGTPWERVARFGNRPGTTWLEPDGTPHNESGSLRFSAAVSDEAAQQIFAAASRPLNPILDQAARRQRPRGFAMRANARVAREAGPEATRMSSPNVIAVLPGTDPSVANEYVLLTAHLDHIGIREPRPNDAPDADRINNGALDNATGIATLIEVARAFSRPGNRPRRPILIAAVAAEEKGLLGAQYLAQHPLVPAGARVISDVNLDMPILTYDFQDVIAFGAEHSTMGPIVARAAARMNVRLTPDPLPEQGLFTRSDHYNFVKAGIPSVFLMTGFANGGDAAFRGFLAGNYHGVGDDLSQNINWQAGARFAQLNYLIAREIADGDEVPRWYRGSFFGDAFGGDQARAEAPTGADAVVGAGSTRTHRR